MPFIKNFIKKFIPEIILHKDDFEQNWINEKMSEIQPNSRVLDCGAGGLSNKNYCKHLDYVSIDFGKYVANSIDEGIQDEQILGKLDVIGDAHNLMFKDNTFDAVLLTEVLEHTFDPLKILFEIHRILKNNGVLIVTTPFAHPSHMAPHHYFSGFSTYFYRYNLTKIGFKITESKKFGNYFDWVAAELLRTNVSVAEKYSHHKLNILEKIILFSSIVVFKKLAKMDKNSNQLAYFTDLIVAKKI